MLTSLNLLWADYFIPLLMFIFEFLYFGGWANLPTPIRNRVKQRLSMDPHFFSEIFTRSGSEINTPGPGS